MLSTDIILTATSTIRTKLAAISADLDGVLSMCKGRLNALPLPLPPVIKLPEDDMAVYEKILGTSTIYCKHCHREQHLSCFRISLQKCQEKGVLGMRAIKTCDKMIAINDRHNVYANPINNTKTSIKRYTALRDAATGGDVAALNAKLAQLEVKLAEAIRRKQEWEASCKE
jgi:hypothetical protein